MQKMLSSTQEEVTRLEELMGSLRQTIENLKMQGSVEEAKFAAAIRKMEAEHQIEMEKKVSSCVTITSIYSFSQWRRCNEFEI